MSENEQAGLSDIAERQPTQRWSELPPRPTELIEMVETGSPRDIPEPLGDLETQQALHWAG